MKYTSRIDVLNSILGTRIVPIFSHSQANTVIQVIEACLAAELPLLEFTNRAALALDTFTSVSRHFYEKKTPVLLGAGSVFDAATAAAYLNAGAAFIVSPIFDAEIASLCNQRKVAYMPGCNTPTEISRAEESGVEIVKLFPASSFEPQFIKDIHGPMPWTRIMPTGGINPSNMKGWLDAGAACVGMGSSLISKEHLANNDFAALEKDLAEARALAQKVS